MRMPNGFESSLVIEVFDRDCVAVSSYQPSLSLAPNVDSTCWSDPELCVCQQPAIRAAPVSNLGNFWRLAMLVWNTVDSFSGAAAIA